MNESSPRPSWWESQPAIIAFMIGVFPVGLFLMWRFAPWKARTKWIWSGLFASLVALIVLGSIFGEEEQDSGGSDSSVAVLRTPTIEPTTDTESASPPAAQTDTPTPPAATETAAPTDTQTEVPTQPPETSRCEIVPPELLAAIASGLSVAGGGTLREAQAVKSADYTKAWFVAAEIDGPGLEGDGDIGLWVTNGLDSSYGLIYSVDGVANEFSDWGDGGATDAGFSQFDDGAQEAVDCLRT